MAADVGWWCKSTDLRVASVRIRARLIMRALAARGVNADWFEARGAAGYRTLVISKRYDDATLATALAHQARGGRLVLDLCDNHFIAASDDPKHQRQRHNLLSLARAADAITVSAAPLAAICAEHCPEAVTARVITDLRDDLSCVPQPPHQRLLTAFKLQRERAHLRRLAAAGAAPLVWFGNSDGRQGQSGLVDLARLLPLLAQLHAQRPLHLSVISNSRERYQQLIAGRGLPSRFIAWDPWSFDALLPLHGVCLIPATPNAFTVCKSDNRMVTALLAGVPVVADAVPSYAAYADVAVLGDFGGGLQRYLGDPAVAQAQAARGRQRALDLTDEAAITGRWREALAV